jgi:hypothetical protein
MSQLTIDLPPELEEQLQQEAARRGQGIGEYARMLLEEHLSGFNGQGEGVDRLLRLPRATPEQIEALVRQQGGRPVERIEADGQLLAGGGAR